MFFWIILIIFSSGFYIYFVVSFVHLVFLYSFVLLPLFFYSLSLYAFFFVNILNAVNRNAMIFYLRFSSHSSHLLWISNCHILFSFTEWCINNAVDFFLFYIPIFSFLSYIYLIRRFISSLPFTTSFVLFSPFSHILSTNVFVVLFFFIAFPINFNFSSTSQNLNNLIYLFLMFLYCCVLCVVSFHFQFCLLFLIPLFF
jgi:hypothetical protein